MSREGLPQEWLRVLLGDEHWESPRAEHTAWRASRAPCCQHEGSGQDRLSPFGSIVSTRELSTADGLSISTGVCGRTRPNVSMYVESGREAPNVQYLQSADASTRAFG